MRGIQLLPAALALILLPAAARAADPPADGKLRIIVFGAHPDDAEFKAGGTAIKWSKAGHHVKLVSVTNGDIGHWQLRKEPLASQVYEGGANGSEAFVAGVPPATDVEGRKKWLRRQWEGRQKREADAHRDVVVKFYGPEKGKQVRYAETFEVCEYGRRPSAEELRKLFPFFE
jgi:GlcNAc-PI de-N-acetylase